jgi:hypothetical protein
LPQIGLLVTSLSLVSWTLVDFLIFANSATVVAIVLGSLPNFPHHSNTSALEVLIKNKDERNNTINNINAFLFVFMTKL